MQDQNEHTSSQGKTVEASDNFLLKALLVLILMGINHVIIVITDWPDKLFDLKSFFGFKPGADYFMGLQAVIVMGVYVFCLFFISLLIVIIATEFIAYRNKVKDKLPPQN